MTDEHHIAMPIATITLDYGLDPDGEPTLIETTTNHVAPDQPVPMIERLGILAMAQQTAAVEAAMHELRDMD